MFKRSLKLLGVVFFGCLLAACGDQDSKDMLRVGTIAGPETDLMRVAKKVAKKNYGLTIKIIQFSDYNMPNAALNDGSIDANMFQHQPFLDAQIKAYGYKIATVGRTFIYPMGLYSRKIKNLSELKSGDKVAIPNDPSNEARALLLLEQAKLIKLKPGTDISAVPSDIIENPKQLKIIELDAPEMPRALADVSLAAINTNYAVPAGLFPKTDALVHEDSTSPYANIIVVREKDVENPKVKELVKALQSPEVKDKAKELFGQGAVAAW